MRSLEDQLGVRLLIRTTRSVSPTDAGERLYGNLAPLFEQIGTEVAGLSELRDKPAGTIRITAVDYAVDTILWPKLVQFLPKYPDINIELDISYALTDIAAEGYDAGVRLGEQVEKDMIAVRIGPDFRMAVVGSPAYLAQQPLPHTPQDLTGLKCINLRLPTYGGLYAWEFERGGQEVKVRVDGQLVFNTATRMLQAALAGLGLCYTPEDLAQPYIADGSLVPVLEDWWPTTPGCHLYYPSRRQSSPAFNLLVKTLRYEV
jgi:DNA-binding transcriptional LysR family regulator